MLHRLLKFVVLVILLGLSPCWPVTMFVQPVAEVFFSASAQPSVNEFVSFLRGVGICRSESDYNTTSCVYDVPQKCSNGSIIDIEPQFVHDELKSFDEWTKAKLEIEKEKASLKVNAHSVQEAKHLSSDATVLSGSTSPDHLSSVDPKSPGKSTNGHSVHASIPTTESTVIPSSDESDAQRNYVSKECGAKVLQSNPEATNIVSILKDKDKDEYMLNPCQTPGPKWIVMELCEMIQVTRLQLANYELFSSSPKEFRLWSSKRYPSPEWMLLGEWTAADVKHVQEFEVIPKQIYRMSLIEEIEKAEDDPTVVLPDPMIPGTTPMIHTSSDVTTQDDPLTPPAPSLDLNSIKLVKLPVALSVAETDAQTGNNSDNIENKTLVTKVMDMANRLFSSMTNAVGTTGDAGDMQHTGTAIGSHSCGLDKPFHRLIAQCMTSSKHYCHSCHYFKLLTVKRKLSHFQRNNQFHAVNDEEGHTKTVPKRQRVRRWSTCHPSDPLFRPQILPLPRSGAAIRLPGKVPAAATKPSPEQPKAPAPPSDSKEETGSPPKPTQTPPTAVPSQKGDATHQSATATPTPASPPVVLPGKTINPSESIFIRLTNRIKALELNLSLSSQYLNELSRNYKRQTEEWQKANNKTQHALSAYNTATQQANAYKAELTQMRQDMTALKDLVSILRHQQHYYQDEYWRWQSVMVAVEVLVLFAILCKCVTWNAGRNNVTHRAMTDVDHVMSPPGQGHIPNGHVPRDCNDNQVKSELVVVPRPFYFEEEEKRGVDDLIDTRRASLPDISSHAVGDYTSNITTTHDIVTTSQCSTKNSPKFKRYPLHVDSSWRKAGKYKKKSKCNFYSNHSGSASCLSGDGVELRDPGGEFLKTVKRPSVVYKSPNSFSPLKSAII